MVFNAIFNNISVLLVEETGVPVENHRPVASHWQTVSHNVVSNRVRIHNIIGDRYYWQSLLGEGICLYDLNIIQSQTLKQKIKIKLLFCKKKQHYYI